MRRSTQKQNRQAHLALQQAYDEHIIEPLRFMPDVYDWQLPGPDPIAAEMLRREPPEPKRQDKITDQLDEPARDTRAQYFQDVSFFHTPPAIVPGGAHEVARFITSINETGVVNLIWTYAEIDDGAGNVIELDPRLPFAVQQALGLGVNDLFWFLRLEYGPFQKTIPIPLRAPIGTIPGYGYSNLNQWTDYRFQWGRTQTNVFFLIPALHALRLYFYIAEPFQDLVRIGGRLKGYTQPSDTRPTGWNVVHGF